MKIPPEQEQYIIELYRDGNSLNSIAKLLSVNKTTVWRHLKLSNEPTRLPSYTSSDFSIMLSLYYRSL